jgi:DNA-binding transcriptional MerR regulator
LWEAVAVDDETSAELSLDELAERSGVSSRTIRYYQSEGVLPAPRRDGRDARYNPGHLERLELVGELQARGLKLEAIKSLLDRAGKQKTSVTEWLGIDEALRASWTDDHAATMTLAEVHQRLGKRPRRLVGELVDAGLLERQDDGSFIAPSDALLDLSLRLVDAGVSLDVSQHAAELLRRRLARAADDLVKLFETETGRSFAGGGAPEEISAALDAVRPVALDAAGLILAQELERALRKLAATGSSKSRRS